jgi:hypothetical protein
MDLARSNSPAIHEERYKLLPYIYAAAEMSRTGSDDAALFLVSQLDFGWASLTSMPE